MRKREQPVRSETSQAPSVRSAALREAAARGQIQAVRAEIEKGVDINTSDELGRTALMFAAGEGQLEVVKILIEHGADPSLKDVDGDTALAFAQRNGHAQVVGVLKQGLQ